MNILQGSQNTHVQNLVAYHVEGGLHQSLTISADSQRSISDILQPITDASHARDRKRSPSDSACFPGGTRLQVVKGINAWARTDIAGDSEPHMHGYVGSRIWQILHIAGGERSKIWRLATTLASQMAATIPQTEPFIREAVDADSALLRPDEGGVSLRTRMQRLVYAPFKAVVQRQKRIRALTQGPFLIVLDGLDECDDKDEVQELIDGMLNFFSENPLIPLRVFITSRVEEHIQSRLDVPGVRLDNHCTDDDIATFLHILFEDACRRNSVVRAYVQQHGEWPTQSDRRKLVKHIGGSFIFASTVFKFIMATSAEGTDPPTPMDRLPLALKMNPGLDGLYTQTLARSMHLPHFSNILSTIALLFEPLSTSGIAELLGIQAYEAVNVLVNLQAIIQVPGTDDIPVTLCHTSLRDFLTTPSRSRGFCAHPAHHVRLFFRCLEWQLKHLRQDQDTFIRSNKQIPAFPYYAPDRGSLRHLELGKRYFKLPETDAAIQLCREALTLRPRSFEMIGILAHVVCNRGRQTRSLKDLDEAISLWRVALRLRPPPNLSGECLPSCNGLGSAECSSSCNLLGSAGCSSSCNGLGSALLDRHRCTGNMADLMEAICMHRVALRLRPSAHPGRSDSLTGLCDTLLKSYELTRTVADLTEAISLLHEALELRPSPDPERSLTLNNLGNALLDRHRHTRSMTDLEAAISLHHEALELRPSPHPDRSSTLNNLGNALLDRHWRTRSMTDLKAAISLHREALKLRPSPHPDRSSTLDNLGNALQGLHRHTGSVADLEEAISLHRQVLELRPSPDPNRSSTLNNLGSALRDLHRRTRSIANLKEAISLLREALEGQPYLRSLILNNLIKSLQSMYRETRTFAHLQEAIVHCEKSLAFHHPVGHRYRAQCLRLLASLLQLRFEATGQEDDLSRISTLEDEANRLSAPSTDDSIP